MRVIVLSVGILASSMAFSQEKTGINTTNPKATLEIVTTTANTASDIEGVLIPRVTKEKAYLMANATTTPEESTMIYVNNIVYTFPTGATDTQKAKVSDITENGYYFWDTVKWTKLKGEDWHLTGNSGTNPDVNFIGTIDDKPLAFRVSNSYSGHLGSRNLSLGIDSTPYNTLGEDNVAIGNFTLQSVTRSTQYEGFANVAIGTKSLSENTTGAANVGIGNYTLSKNQKGKSNVAIGAFALRAFELGSFNLAIGSGNVAQIDYSALGSLRIGYSNVALGSYSLHSIVNSSNNTAVGIGSLGELESGNANVALGMNAGRNLKTGDNNIFIGTGEPNISQNASNQINIGNAIFGYNGKIGIGAAYKGGGYSSNNIVVGQSPTEQFEVDGSIKLLKINSASYTSTEATDKVVVANTDGVLKTKDVSTLVAGSEPWYNVATNTGATENIQDMYTMGKVGIGTDTPKAMLHVVSEGNNIGDANDFLFDVYKSTDDFVPFVTRVARGSAETPAAVQNGDWLGGISNMVYLGGSFNAQASVTQIKNKYTGDGTTRKGEMIFRTSNKNRMVINDEGNIGVGTDTPAGDYRLDVKGKLYLHHKNNPETELNDFGHIGYTAKYGRFAVGNFHGTASGNESSEPGDAALWVNGKNTFETTGDRAYANGAFVAITNSNPGTTKDIVNYPNNIMIFNKEGNLGLGLKVPTEKLDVAGKVKANSFISTVSGANVFPDYVFEKYYNGNSMLNENYDFKSLNEVETFVKAKGHLPGYTSAKEISKKGQFNMTEVQLTNVEKIEELYLHTIEQEKKIETQAKENAILKEKVERLEKILNQLLEK